MFEKRTPVASDSVCKQLNCVVINLFAHFTNVARPVITIFSISDVTFDRASSRKLSYTDTA